VLTWGFRTDEKKIRIERLLLSRHGLYVTDFSFSKFNFSGTFLNYNDALDEIDETMT